MFDSFFQAVLCSGSRKTETAVEDLTPKAAPRRFKYPANLINEEDSSDTTSQNKKYLVLDLDETLIHTRDTPFEKDIPSLHFRTSKSQNKFYVAIRPHLIEFLEEMSQLYTIVIFTAASKDYAEAVIKRLKIGKYIETLFHREDCTSTWTGLTKNLAILGVPLKDVILVDDLIDNSRYQPDNFLLIHSFQGQKNDQALTKLIPFLKELAGVADVRNVDERYNKYYERLKMAEGLKKVADDVAAQMEKSESSKNEDPKEPVSPGLSDNEPVSGSIVSPPTSLSSLDVKPQGSLLMRTARGFYASLIRVPA